MNSIGKFVPISLFLFFTSSIFFAQTSSQSGLSSRLYDFFLQKGFQPEKQLLGSDEQFPFSVLLNFNQQGFYDIKEVPRFIISLSQDVAAQCLDELLVLAQKMKNNTSGSSFTLALLANENPPFDHNNQLHPTGSQILLESIDNMDSCAIVMLDGNSKRFEDTTVVFGAGGILTPLWLIQQVPLPISHNFLITYRLNLAEDNPTLLPFFQSGIATVGISFDGGQQSQKQEVFSALETMVDDFSVAERESGNSQNYIVFHLLENIWIGEEIPILIYLLITILVLAIISGFSFLGKRGAINRQSFFKIWYLIPITIFLSTLFLWLGQLVAGKLVEVSPENTTWILGIKTLFSFVIVSLPFIFHLRLRSPITQFAYGYLLTIVVAMNIFIFASIDLVLLFIFVFEYIIIYLSRLVRRVFPLVVASFVMVLPFIPYSLNILEYASQDKLLNLVYSGLWGNVLYACILIPFQIMWLRILVRIDIFGFHRHISPFKIFLAIVVVMIAMIISILATILLGSYLLYRTVPGNEANDQVQTSQKYQIIDESPPKDINVSVSRIGYLELQRVEVSVSSPLPVLRYEVRVSSEKQIPVYDSAMGYVTIQDEENAMVNFLIPDYPDDKTSFEYTANEDTSQIIDVSVYLEVAPQEAIVVQRIFFLPALEQGL